MTIGADNFVLKELTSKSEVRQERSALGHKIGSETALRKLASGQSHIIAISDAAGERVSTAELICSSYSPLQIRLRDHRGVKNDTMTNHPASTALSRLIDKLKGQDFTPVGLRLFSTDKKAYGETKESRERNQKGKAVSIIGFDPTWENINNIFQEYKRNLRAGSEIDYSDMEEGNVGRITHLHKTLRGHDLPAAVVTPRQLSWVRRMKKHDAIHMIDGDDKLARNMDAKTWLYRTHIDSNTGQETNYMEQIHEAIGRVDKTLAASLRSEWEGAFDSFKPACNQSPPRTDGHGRH